jgi:hypothetical protein
MKNMVRGDFQVGPSGVSSNFEGGAGLDDKDSQSEADKAAKRLSDAEREFNQSQDPEGKD